jgi:hypothetical protein
VFVHCKTLKSSLLLGTKEKDTLVVIGSKELRYWTLTVFYSNSNLERPKSNFWLGVQHLRRLTKLKSLVAGMNETKQNWMYVYCSGILLKALVLYEPLNSQYFLSNIVYYWKSFCTFLFKICSKWVVGEVKFENRTFLSTKCLLASFHLLPFLQNDWN